MQRFICIHGHFYQPPRENPWLESVELQDSAAPYHDWNGRITAECYAPNAKARILNGEHKIAEITNNYSKISFNFGPTLLAWMKEKMPDVHEAIVAADKLSRQRFSGHGSAIAQAYNHMILPLANTRDKQTQVIWGIRDFEFRFGRLPEGMWLAETAADIPTLDALAQHGIKFTILSPFQASRVKEIGKRNFRDVNGAQIDPTRPYLVRLPEGRSIAVFFYDAPISQAIAFERLLTSGEKLADRLTEAFNDRRQWDQLVHIATDGESYGHHHRYGEMALAYALQHIEKTGVAQLTNYGEYLEKHPPTHEVQIHDKSAWSCSHGVGRWMRDCGCNTGGHAGWSQAWREPLRNALDWLRDELAPLYEAKASEYMRDPWKARNDYISVILNRSPENIDRFFGERQTRDLSPEDKITGLKLLELQRHAMLMYTSCGWFFDEVTGIETVQVIQYAARALQLGRDVLQKDLEPGFLDRLDAARSNMPEKGGGRQIFEMYVKPAMIDWPKAAAHYAISSIFHQYEPRTRIFSFSIEEEDRQVFSSGKTRLVAGRIKLISEITKEFDTLAYAMLYMGEHNVTGGVSRFASVGDYDTMLREVKAAYDTADFPETIRVLDRHFGQTTYSLKSLFKDEQRRILNEILASTREDLEGRFRLITERYEPLAKFMQTVHAPPPPALEAVFDMVLHGDVRKAIEAEKPDLDRLRGLLHSAAAHNGRVLDEDISYAVKSRLERLIQDLGAQPEDIARIGAIQQFAEAVMPVNLGLNLWKVQDIYWDLLQKVAPNFRAKAQGGDEASREWLSQFARLGEKLGFAVEALRVETPPKDVALAA
jgi:alpha-amylase/alpha-mannosidase (GH57 family)